MTQVKFIYLASICIATMFTFSIAGCKKDEINFTKVKDYAFIVKGVSGNDVMLDRTWYQECISGGPGVWTKSMRTMSGHELATTVTEYQNGSTTPDCTNGCSSVLVYVQTLTNDNVRVPITWTDAQGNPAAAPAGLENVTEGNGATGVVTYAMLTPFTQAKADQLNSVSFCGHSDWAPGVTIDILPCFSGGPAKGTVIVDDRTDTGSVYDGISIDPTQYPTMIPNTAPHKGPLTRVIL